MEIRINQLNTDIRELEELKADADKNLNIPVKRYAEIVKDLKGLKELKSTLIYSS